MNKVDREIEIVSMNTQGHEHISRILPFLKERNSEVVLLQDCFERTSSMISDGLGIEHFFVPQRSKDLYFPYGGGTEICGNSTLSRNGFLSTELFNYVDDGQTEIPLHHEWSPGEEFDRLRRTVLVTEIPKGPESILIGNFYFTWTPDGKPSDFQRRDARVLLEYLDRYSRLILCGDTNSPRGGEIFKMFTDKFEDNIPQNILSTLDPELHPASKKGVNVVVDGLFTRGYRISDVEIVSGVSDHCAVAAKIIVS